MFTINGVKWNIEYVPSNSRLLMRTDGTQTLGVTDTNVKMVYLSSALRGALLERVLTHELCHCAMFSYGIYVPLETEELICEFVALHGKEVITLVDNLFDTMRRHIV